mgnify:CR=1 FL=1
MQAQNNTKSCLIAEGISVHFGGLKALDGVDVCIEKGDILGLLGPNGSGKTTFLNAITGVYKLFSGNFFFLGEKVTGLPPHKIRLQGIARTFQSNRLCWDLSLLDNILLGMQSKQSAGVWDVVFRRSVAEKETQEGIKKAIEVIQEFNPDLIERFHEPVSAIPLIDRRRVEIARALVSSPALLLLDEPTAGLNDVETEKVIEDVTRLKHRDPEMSIIIIEHDMSVISKICNRVIVLNAGKKIAEGPYLEVVVNPEVKKAYLGDDEELC